MPNASPEEYAAALRQEAREMAARELVARGRRPELYSSAADHAGSEGMVTVWGTDGRYLGCIGVETWERLLRDLADREDEWELADYDRDEADAAAPLTVNVTYSCGHIVTHPRDGIWRGSCDVCRRLASLIVGIHTGRPGKAV